MAYINITQDDINSAISRVPAEKVYFIRATATALKELGGMDAINSGEYEEASELFQTYMELVNCVDCCSEHWGACEAAKEILPNFNY